MIGISFGFSLFFITWFVKNFNLTIQKKIIYCVIVLFLSYVVIPNYSKDHVRENFSYQKLNNSLNNHQKIMVVASASWCITCYFNEKNALESSEFINLLAKKDVKYLYLDLTNSNQEGENFLMEYKHSGVPFYILFDSLGGYEILPQTLTKSFIIQKIENLI